MKRIEMNFYNYNLRLAIRFFIETFVVPHVETHSTFFTFKTNLVPDLKLTSQISVLLIYIKI